MLFLTDNNRVPSVARWVHLTIFNGGGYQVWSSGGW
jgi:hypothetical protein